MIRIYYDSCRNLVARGVIPEPHYRYAQRQPEPFPQALSPIPKGTRLANGDASHLDAHRPL